MTNPSASGDASRRVADEITTGERQRQERRSTLMLIWIVRKQNTLLKTGFRRQKLENSVSVDPKIKYSI